MSIPLNELPFQIQEAEENFTNHLKINQDKYLPKEDISLDDVVITEKVTNLTTFAAQSGLKKVPCPVVPTALVSQEIIPPSSEPVKEKEKVEGKLSRRFYFSLIYLFISGINIFNLWNWASDEPWKRNEIFYILICLKIMIYFFLIKLLV